MMSKRYRQMAALVAVAVCMSHLAGAQTQAADPSARLREVLPETIAQRVLATIESARTQELPAEALENRALKFAAKGVSPENIARSVDEQLQRMRVAKTVLEKARGRTPHGEEIAAGAEAMRGGVDGALVSQLARSVPSERSLAVPLYVVGSLVDLGLQPADALARVQARLRDKVSDADLGKLPGTVARPAERRGPPAHAGRGAANAGRGNAGPPPNVPANAGKGKRPDPPRKPPTPQR